MDNKRVHRALDRREDRLRKKLLLPQDLNLSLFSIKKAD